MFRTFLTTTYLLLSLVWSPAALAMDPAHERQLLLKLYQQLESLTPLLDAAQQAQMPNARRRFHYEAFTDHQGNTHTGLRDDLDAIKTGLLAYLQDQRQQPRHIPPIDGDYRS